MAFGLKHTIPQTVVMVMTATVVAAAAVPARAESATPRPKAPFKVLYSNDMTHITTCLSPYHPTPGAATIDMVNASVDETAGCGIDAHMLQPGLGWIPFWNSAVVPLKDQRDWFRQRYGIEPNNSFTALILAGDDIVEVFVRRCREKGLKPFVSYRLNDAHHLEHADGKPQPWMFETICQFYAEHPEYRLGKTPEEWSRWDRKGQNWAIPEVREYKFKLIQELAEKYDIDGMELDYQRFPCFFRQDETAFQQRVTIMVEFIARVRAVLDRTAKPRQYRWLGVRIPDDLQSLEEVGVDLARFRAAGVDFFNVSSFYETRLPRAELPTMRRRAPDAAFYYELHHTPQVWNVADIPGSYDTQMFRRCTRELLRTTAHMAYPRGCDGVSLFNFPYYRQFGPGSDLRGPFNAPPFEVIDDLRNPEALATGDQYYYLSTGNWGAHRRFAPGDRQTFRLDLELDAAQIAPGTQRILRLQVLGEAEAKRAECRSLETELLAPRGQWRVYLNGTELRRHTGPLFLYPFPTPIQAGFGRLEQYLAWDVPASLLKLGWNGIDVVLVEADSPRILRWIDLTMKRNRVAEPDGSGSTSTP